MFPRMNGGPKRKSRRFGRRTWLELSDFVNWSSNTFFFHSQEAGIARPLARTIGISVDHRRQNLSEESLAVNVARLKAYKERLILLPRKSNAPKKGDTKTDLSKVNTATSISSVLPIAPTDIAVKEIKKSEMPKPIDGGAYAALRMARSNKRYQGAREKRIRDKAEAETAKK